VGCGSGNNVSAGATVSPVNNPPAIGWDKSPNAIIFRLDRILNGEAPVNAANRLPLCTLSGNGHLVWVNIIPPNGEQVLETQLDDTAIRAFLDFLIRQQHFYSIVDYAAAQLPPNGQYEIETAVLNLNNAVRTVRSYAQWPNNEFQLMLDACTHLTKQPVLYVPAGAWMSVVPVVGASSDSPVNWSEHVPFRLSDLAASPNPMWLSGEILGTLWLQLRRTVGAIRWQENDKSYKIMLQVPNVSRDSPAAPLVTPTSQGLITLTPPIYPTLTPTTVKPTIASTAIKPTAASGSSS
jgi:hypothetical protein